MFCCISPWKDIKVLNCPRRKALLTYREMAKNTVLLGMVVHTYNPSYSGGEGKRIMSSRSAWAKLARSYLRIQKGLGSSSSGRALAL
jgi:hypothetical protein